jgi:hypothetical protein
MYLVPQNLSIYMACYFDSMQLTYDFWIPNINYLAYDYIYIYRDYIVVWTHHISDFGTGDRLFNTCLRKESQQNTLTDVPSSSIHVVPSTLQEWPRKWGKWLGNRCGKQTSIAFLSHILFMYMICIYQSEYGTSFFRSGGNGNPFW